MKGAVICLLVGSCFCAFSFLLGLVSAVSRAEYLGWASVWVLVAGIVTFLVGFVFAVVDTIRDWNK